MNKFLICLNIFVFITPLPVAILHGFYDSCENSYFPSLVNLIKYNIGDYSICIETGGGGDSLSLSFQEQAEKACEEIKKNVKFHKDFSILSISQGGLLARYIIIIYKSRGSFGQIYYTKMRNARTSKKFSCIWRANDGDI